MNQQGTHSREEIMELLDGLEVAAISTAAGDRLRTRMMHYGVDKDFNFYLASMKGDPKTLQITHHPSVSILAFKQEENINDSREVEVIGKAVMVRDDAERQRALEATARKSPVVKYMMETGNQGLLDCIKVVPETVKFRVFREIVQGMPPTVMEFPQHRVVVNDWSLLNLKLRNWVTEVRVPFLSASVVPILLGSAIAGMASGTFHWGFFLLTLLGGVLLQAGTNVMNDYADHRSGNDDINQEFVRPFSGGSRIIQLGLLSPLEVLSGALLFFTLGSLIGLYLVWARGWPVLALGVVGVASGFFYSLKPVDWGSRGVGETAVGLNFGILMALGAYYVQTLSFSWVPVVAALPVSLLIAAVLYINEFPDYHADKAVGKNTLVVRLGRHRAVVGYLALMATTYISIIVGVAWGILPWFTLLALVTLPLAVKGVLNARKHYASSYDLIPANAATILVHLAVGLILTLAFLWEAFQVQGLLYVAVAGTVFLLYVLYEYRHIEQQKNAFLGLKRSVG